MANLFDQIFNREKTILWTLRTGARKHENTKTRKHQTVEIFNSKKKII